MKHSLWVEKYRPRSLSDVVFQDPAQDKKFKSFVANGDIPNLLLSGIQGTGKTTISRAIIRDLGVDPTDVLKINCSDEKIDALREKVKAFSMTIPNGKFKVVRLEEFDHLSLDGQALLRALIEDSSASCRFIATCNYENRVIPALKSRFVHVDFRAPDKEQVALRMVHILESEKIGFNPEDLLTYIDVGYPDIRKIIQLLQENSASGTLSLPSASASSIDWKFSLLDAVSKGEWKTARKIVCDSASKEEHEDVYRFLYENIGKLGVQDPEAAIVTIAEYLYKHSIVADTEINLAACFIALSKS
jgi:DNA polymerase III delta prime subunit